MYTLIFIFLIHTYFKWSEDTFFFPFTFFRPALYVKDEKIDITKGWWHHLTILFFLLERIIDLYLFSDFNVFFFWFYIRTDTSNFNVIVEKVKLHTWWWFKVYKSSLALDFHAWWSNPSLCIGYFTGWCRLLASFFFAFWFSCNARLVLIPGYVAWLFKKIKSIGSLFCYGWNKLISFF